MANSRKEACLASSVARNATGGAQGAGDASAAATQVSYSTKQLAELAGVSPRTLRYYDSIGLLSPSRDANGYRSYGTRDVRRLQHILMLRNCRLPLAAIERALCDPGFDLRGTLAAHLDSPCAQQSSLQHTIETVRKAVAGLEAYEEMNDEQKFEQLKRQSVDRFEAEYGAEARERYGSKAIDEANERFLGMDRATWESKEQLEADIKSTLAAVMRTGDASSPEAARLAAMHAQWIRMHWGEGAYTPDAHRALAQGYLTDARFVDYYDSAAGEGATTFLNEVIQANV